MIRTDTLLTANPRQRYRYARLSAVFWDVELDCGESGEGFLAAAPKQGFLINGVASTVTACGFGRPFLSYSSIRTTISGSDS